MVRAQRDDEGFFGAAMLLCLAHQRPPQPP
jgi:hypothetical protein